MGLNRVQLLGFVGGQPEVVNTTNSKVARLTLATSETYKDKNGEKKTSTEWHKLVAWGKLAEIIEKYVKKGSHLYIEGKLTTRSYEKDGKTNYITEVNVSTIEMLGNKGNSQSGGQEDDSNDLPW